MFSGKTSELIRRLSRYKHGKHKKKICYIKPKYDTRDDGLKTHSGVKQKVDFVVEILKNLKTKLDEYQVIGIDEGHFFKSKNDLIEFCCFMANKRGKIVIVAGLDADYKKNAFNEICSLIPKCERVDKLDSVCDFCSESASFSMKYTKNGKNEKYKIGGSETYKPVCRKCYYKNNIHK